MSHYNAKKAAYDADGGIILLPIEDDVAEEQKSTTIFAPKSNPSPSPSPSHNPIVSTICFAGTFTAVFLFLFVALNFKSYSQVFRAQLFPDDMKSEQVALEVMTDRYMPLLSDDLPTPPRLPTAGLAVGLPDVVPPDNRLVVPKIGKNIPMVEVSDAALRRGDWKMFEKDIQHALKFGVVRYPGTAEPGQIGNVFITGHSSFYPWDWGEYKDVFVLLPSLEIGDEYSIYNDGDLHHYRVIEKLEVSPKDVSVLDQPHDAFISTLMTCTPVGTTLKRLVVRGQEFDPATGEIMKVVGIDPDNTENIQWGGELAI